MATNSTGNCYLCGASLGTTAMKNHLLKVHAGADLSGDKTGQECRLLKIEGAFDKQYWLFIDVPADKTLAAVDGFLRKIWLECCGHMSEFCVEPWQDKIGMTRKLGSFAAGEKFFHIYDFGTTTETLITVMGTTNRKPQKGPVRLLARNTPPVFECEECGKPAVYLCEKQVEPFDTPFYCADCGEKREDDNHFMHKVTNSPRMGECAYDGELDVFAFNPEAFPKTAKS